MSNKKSNLRKMIAALAVMVAVASSTAFAEETSEDAEVTTEETSVETSVETEPVEESSSDEVASEETEEEASTEEDSQDADNDADTISDEEDSEALKDAEEEELEDELEEKGKKKTKVYTVKFVDTIDEEVFAEYEVKEGESVEELPEAPEHEGYEFVEYKGNYQEVSEDETVEAIYKKKEVTLEKGELTANIGDYKITVKGNLPENAKLSVKENTDVKSLTNSISDSLSSSRGYFNIVAFDIKLNYTFAGETKDFVPADFDEEYTVTVSNLGRSETASVYSLDGYKNLSSDGASFTMTNETSVAVGITYNCDCAICGILSDGEKNCKVCAYGKGVTYTTTANKYGWYLFSNVDYSKAYFGCVFEIATK